MKTTKQGLLLQQTEKKLKPFEYVRSYQIPSKGWINTIRVSINMTLRQLGDRLGKKAQTIQDFEKREQSGTITLQSLQEIAHALDMHVVYAFVPNENNLSDMIDKKAEEKARQIVDRTNITMDLEKQGLRQDQLQALVMEKKNELKSEIPKFLWD